MKKFARIVGNIIWFFTGGLASAITMALFGLLLLITIIGIPFAITLFKLIPLFMLPFGKQADINWGSHPIVNTIWVIFFGWELALLSLIIGILLCITIILIPVGLQAFKFAKVYLFPFGCKVTKLD